jgi:CHAT domain/NB-ARC domain
MKQGRSGSSTLIIEHIDSSSPATFRLCRLCDGGSLGSHELVSPHDTAVEDQPNSNLMRELRWYLESFLDYPFAPEIDRADHVLDALKGWGKKVFNTLFDRRDARKWLSRSSILQIRSNDPYIMSWPWEALFDPQAGSYIAHQHRIERRLNQLADPPAMRSLPRNRVNILLIIARPYSEDVSYRSIARPLVDLIHAKHLAAHVDILRPPTFDSLRDHLRSRPDYYHIVHFDGHGAYGEGRSSGSPYQIRAQRGCLVFEDSKGEEDLKSADDLSALLHEHAVPAVVLNACQSAMLDEKAEDAFSSVATALLQSGMHSVVAMAYSLYVSGAQVFLPAFYNRLFVTGNIAEAVRAGRQQMLSDKKRMSVRGPYPLEDWLLPVLYQQAPFSFDFSNRADASEFHSRLPVDIPNRGDEYGFIGRDGSILKMERALLLMAPCILIHGLSGVGKTTLVRGFLNWLDRTGGLDNALWFDFRDIRSAEYVINRIGEALCNDTFSASTDKHRLIAEVMAKRRLLIVWDNFESAHQNFSEDDFAELGRFLDSIRDGRGKVILTSRLSEGWLSPHQRLPITLGGLDGEERWEYCEVILRELGLRVNRNDPNLISLMDQLAGHPLAMRLILPKLEHMTAAMIADALHTNAAELGLNEEVESSLHASLRLVNQEIPSEVHPLMSLVGLHEQYLETNLFAVMAHQVNSGWTQTEIGDLFAEFARAGTVRYLGKDVYELHPLLVSYLRLRETSSEADQRAFVDVMGSFAETLGPRGPELQRKVISFLGANFYSALKLSQVLGMDSDFAAISQVLANFAFDSRNFIEAFRLFQGLLPHATRNHPDLEAHIYSRLGRIAFEQRKFVEAEKWFHKSLETNEES